MFRYDNSDVRRRNRLLPPERAEELLRDGEYGFLAMAGGSGGYGTPLNYVWSGDAIYFHCAPEGEKLRRIAKCPDVAFCVVGRTAPQPAKFTTGYESVMAFGKARIVEDDDERMEALRLLLGKYSPGHMETGMKYAAGSFSRTALIRLDMERVSGKCNPVGL